MNDGQFLSFLIGMIFGAIATALLFVYGSIGEGLLDECEASIPRDQRCVLIATPELVEENRE